MAISSGSAALDFDQFLSDACGETVEICGIPVNQVEHFKSTMPDHYECLKAAYEKETKRPNLTLVK